MKLPQYRLLKISSERKGTSIVAEWVDFVTCGECVKANTEDCSHSYWDDDWGEWRIGYKGDDWFCADGERNSE